MGSPKRIAGVTQRPRPSAPAKDRMRGLQEVKEAYRRASPWVKYPRRIESKFHEERGCSYNAELSPLEGVL